MKKSKTKRSAGAYEIVPKSQAQEDYMKAIDSFDVVFGRGSAGSGKTYLAVAGAIRALQAGDIDRIIITRPIVEAGEKLGFLPGTFQEKVDPYLRPINDAFFELVEPEEFKQWQAQGIIEIAPLAYIRGRTFTRCFMILDEAQNTTPMQMRTFLTRMGQKSKMIINGDPTQIDLPDHMESGLEDALYVLKDTEGVAIIQFSPVDIVRHEVVRRIVSAYEKDDARPE